MQNEIIPITFSVLRMGKITQGKIWKLWGC
jgi:hypothetical protein